jgi:hypothetical protein
MEGYLFKALYLAGLMGVTLLCYMVKRLYRSIDLLFEKYDECRARQNKIDVNMALLAGRLRVRDDEFSDTVVVKRDKAD